MSSLKKCCQVLFHSDEMRKEKENKSKSPPVFESYAHWIRQTNFCILFLFLIVCCFYLRLMLFRAYCAHAHASMDQLWLLLVASTMTLQASIGMIIIAWLYREYKYIELVVIERVFRSLFIVTPRSILNENRHIAEGNKEISSNNIL